MALPLTEVIDRCVSAGFRTNGNKLIAMCCALKTAAMRDLIFLVPVSTGHDSNLL